MNKKKIAAATVAILLGTIIAAVGYSLWYEASDLRSYGIETRGVLLKKYQRPGAAGRWVTTRFADRQGVVQSVEVRVPRFRWSALREGASEPVLYLPENPQRARLSTRAGQETLGIILLSISGVGCMLLLFGLFFLFIAVAGQQ